MAKVLAHPSRPRIERRCGLNRGKTTQVQCKTSMAHQAASGATSEDWLIKPMASWPGLSG